MKLIKEIKSKLGELHFKRWRVLELPWISIYIHGIYKHDEDTHLHSHPWSFISLILKGSYVEETINGVVNRGFLSIAYRNSKDYHKIKKLNTKTVYSLVITGKRYPTWGYKVDNKHVDNNEYRVLKNESKL